jgi:nucleoside-triphosphatase
MACMDKVVLLTGERGVGKTHLCQRVVEQARKLGHSCAGVLCPAVFDGEEKVGITLVDVASGEHRPLAFGDESSGDVRWGRYRFLSSTLEWGAGVLESALPCDLLVVDELGPLELVSGKGLVTALGVLKGGGFALALVVVRPELVDKVKERLRGRDLQVLEVALANRDQLPARIIGLLAEGCG